MKIWNRVKTKKDAQSKSQQRRAKHSREKPSKTKQSSAEQSKNELHDTEMIVYTAVHEQQDKSNYSGVLW